MGRSQNNQITPPARGELAGVADLVGELFASKIAPDLSVPIEVRKFRGAEPNYIPGFGKSSQSLHLYAPQGSLASSYDIPLASAGFGPCWAGVLYDRKSGRSILLHTDDFVTKENQRKKISELLSLPSDGEREVVIVKSSHRTHAYDGTEDYFREIGCRSVRTIMADSDGYHWAIAFSPNDNTIDVITKGDPSGTVCRYRGFSDAVYKPEERAALRVKEREFELVKEAMRFSKWANEKRWLQGYGHLSPDEFRAYVDVAREACPELPSAERVKEVLLGNEYAFERQGKIVIPSMLHWMESEKSKPIYELTNIAPHLKMRVYDYDQCEDLIARVAWEFNGPEMQHLDKNFLILSDEAGGKVLLYFGTDSISFHEVAEGDLMRRTLNKMSGIVAGRRYGFSGDFGSTAWDGRLPTFTPEHWAEFVRDRRFHAELMERQKESQR